MREVRREQKAARKAPRQYRKRILKKQMNGALFLACAVAGYGDGGGLVPVFTPGGLGKFNAGDTVDTSGHNRAELYVSWREGRARSPLWAGVDCAGSGGH